MKVYQEYVYATSDSGPTHVYDASDIDNGNVVLVRTINVGSHNLNVDETSGFLYLAVGGPLNIYSLANPANPQFVGSWPGESHDVQVMTYTSGTYAGREIAFVFAGFSGNLDILDVTNKSSISLIGRTTYPNSSYTHQGWLSEDLQYVYINDELDSISRTTIIDVSDLSNPTFVTDYNHGTSATDHNLYYKDGYIFVANYAAGMKVLDAKDPTNLVEVGFFDTYPSDNSSGFVGAWTAYPFFPSGTAIVSDRSGGLFILDPCVAVTPATATSRSAGTNPDSLTSNAPSLGGTFSATVDLGGTTGHAMAALLGYQAATTLPLPGGQTLLVDPLDPGGELFGFPLVSGPSAAFSAPVPSDTSLCGFELSAQGVHIGGVQPFALSNAQDLVVGR